jgi:hypothetical protein
VIGIIIAILVAALVYSLLPAPLRFPAHALAPAGTLPVG